jgi:hypothetical protein
MPNVGERVLAQWPQETDWWYPGVIVSDAGGAIEVQFDDGDRAVLIQQQAKPLDVGLGSRVFCRWKGGQSYYPGIVSSVTGHAIGIDYDDGDKEVSAVGMIRVNVKDL